MKMYRGFEETSKSTEKAFAITTSYNQTSGHQSVIFVPKSRCKFEGGCILIPSWLVSQNNLWNYVSEYANVQDEIRNSKTFTSLVEDLKYWLSDGDSTGEFFEEKMVVKSIKRIMNSVECSTYEEIKTMLIEEVKRV